MRLSRLACACVIATLWNAPPAVAQDRGESDSLNLFDSPFAQPNLGEKLDRALEQFGADGYSGVVLVGWGGLIALHKAYGMANREQEIPNTVNTAFPIGPMSMQFTAAAILKLEMEGRLRTTDTIEQHLGPFPGMKRGATIEDLLTHTAGLADDDAVRSADRASFIQAMKDAPIAFPPGSKIRYSPAGYRLLAAIVEKVAGVAFESYLQEKIFLPAGMHLTRFAGEPSPAASPIAIGYVGGRTILPWLGRLPLPRLSVGLIGPLLRRRAEKLTPAPIELYDWTVRGAGGIVTTVGDLFRWDLALRGESVLSTEAKKRLFTRAVDDQAFAWRVETTSRGTDRFRIGGLENGYESDYVRYAQYLRYVNKDLVVILTVNNDMGWGRAVSMMIEDVTYGENYSTPFAVLCVLVLLLVVGGATRRTKRKKRVRRKWREYRAPTWRRRRRI